MIVTVQSLGPTQPPILHGTGVEMNTGQGTMAVFCGWEGNRRSHRPCNDCGHHGLLTYPTATGSVGKILPFLAFYCLLSFEHFTRPIWSVNVDRQRQKIINSTAVLTENVNPISENSPSAAIHCNS